MAARKTYLLTPNFGFTRDGAIALGNIIADPFAPHRPLTTLDASKPHPEITSKLDYDYTVTRNIDRDISAGTWTKFLGIVGGNVGAQRGNGTNTEYKMESLETIMFRTEPTEAMVTERLQHPLVRNIMHYNSTFRRPIYMISGIKVAKGMKCTTDKGSTKGGNVGATAPVTEGVFLGATVDMSQSRDKSESFRVGVDVVFAYQLLRIGLKGWKAETVTLDEFIPKEALLSDSSDEGE
ncbi:carbohydrate-binding-like protein [Diplodia corticola]|uniref:Carbohydrate-binding-like protein n=1 Tax=Diplodia corticola TaxID=236234 RepID=A0A1J9QLT6_9PEZI|nr:carbohydrate-binding-like protein [Diplodia corticola]OJD29026.1 carbohydrate-binding-like protein [Diplodia corticola]